MREWYDGYCFGPVQGIYCPWDILLYVADLQKTPDARPKAYWSNNARAAVIETRHSSSLKELDGDVNAARNQIIEKEYDAAVKEELDDVLHWGMAFFKKRCLARAEK